MQGASLNLVSDEFQEALDRADLEAPGGRLARRIEIKIEINSSQAVRGTRHFFRAVEVIHEYLNRLGGGGLDWPNCGAAVWWLGMMLCPSPWKAYDGYVYGKAGWVYSYGDRIHCTEERRVEQV